MDNALYPAQIIVKSAVVDETGKYGAKLNIIDTSGKPYTVNEKHKDIWPIFQDNIGKTIILNWNTWQGKTYIDKAQVMITANQMANGQPMQRPPQPAQSVSRPVEPSVAPIPQPKEEPRFSGRTTAEWDKKDAIEGLVALDAAGKLDVITHTVLIQYLIKNAGMVIEAEPTKPELIKGVKK